MYLLYEIFWEEITWKFWQVAPLFFAYFQLAFSSIWFTMPYMGKDLRSGLFQCWKMTENTKELLCAEINWTRQEWSKIPILVCLLLWTRYLTPVTFLLWGAMWQIIISVVRAKDHVPNSVTYMLHNTYVAISLHRLPMALTNFPSIPGTCAAQWSFWVWAQPMRDDVTK